MKAPLVARLAGVAFLLWGGLGFAPMVTVPAGPLDPYVTLGANYGFVAGLLPANAFSDMLHLVVGLCGIAASMRFSAAVRYCRWLTWIALLCVLLGIVPITNTAFGVAPLYGYDVLLDAIAALFALYGGYGAASKEPPGAETGTLAGTA